MSKSSINIPKYDKRIVWASALLAAAVGAIIIFRLQASGPVTPGQSSRSGVAILSAGAYKVGQNATFSLINQSRRPVTLNNSAPWTIVDSANQTVFSPVALQSVTELAPGQSRNWAWDQKNASGNQVPAGQYRIVFPDFGSLRFYIINPSSTASSQKPTPTATHTITYTNAGFSPSNTRFSIGDSIKFVNNTTRALQLSSDPHPQHTDCPEINSGAVARGQSITITPRKSCSFHNHLFPAHLGTFTEVQASSRSN
jgi:hypothetical protein